MSELKIDKYLNKIFRCNEDNKLELYNNKLKLYCESISQSGGEIGSNGIGSNLIGSNLITLIDSYMNDIVANKYRLLTDDQRFIKDWKSCFINKDFFSEDSYIKTIYGFDLNYFCFARQLSFVNFDLTQQIYKFKKSFSLDLTDYYINCVSQEDNSKVVNMIHFSLDYGIKSYIEKTIERGIFGLKSQYIKDNILVLYKGGNTTRIYFNNFIDTILPILKDTVVGNKARDIATKYKSEYKIGDWDFHISIKYDKLQDKGFTENELDIVYKHVTQVIAVVLTYLKSQIELLLRSKKNIDRFSKKIQESYFNDEIKDNINNHIPILNTVVERKLEYLNIKKIHTFDKIIEQNKIIDLKDYKILNRNSFVFFNVPNSEFKINNMKYIKNELVEVDRFQINNKIEKYLPEYLSESYVFISLIKNLSLIRGTMPISTFNLYRCKINVVIEFEVKYINDIFVTNKTKNFSIELIDVSIPTQHDTKSIFLLQYQYANYKPITEININASQFGTTVTKIPSPYYMFCDLASMILGESLFVWEDSKYAKRIFRLMVISVICQISDNISIPIIRNACAMVNDLYSILKNIDTIDDKLNFLTPHFNIVKHPYSDKINQIMNKNLLKPINYNHLVIKLKSNSPYGALNYFDQIIEKYIEMLIISQYILYNRSKYYNYTQYKLSFLNIIDHKDQYIDNNCLVISNGLSDTYKKIRGTPIFINKVPRGPIITSGILSQADQQYIDIMLELFKDFDDTILKLCDFILTILDGLLDAQIDKLDIKYNLDTLF